MKMSMQGGYLLLVCTLFIGFSAAASTFQSISDAHRRGAEELFPAANGSFGSLEETYLALRVFEVLGIDKRSEVNVATCRSVLASFGSQSSTAKDLFYALKVNGALKCQIKDEYFENVISKLQAVVKDASLLLDFYHSIGGLILIKDQTSKDSLELTNAAEVYRSIMALSQSDGRWRYSSNSESSTFASGLAFEALAGTMVLSSSSGIEKSQIAATVSAIEKVFDRIEEYDDGAFYFDEKVIPSHEYQSPLSITSSVVKGMTAFDAVLSSNLNLSKEKILGLAKFFLSLGVPHVTKDMFNQLDSLAYLETSRISIPLIVSVPATVLSLTKKDVLKVKVNTVLGANSPSLLLKLGSVSSSSGDVSTFEAQELGFDPENSVHVIDLPKELDVGSYNFVLEVSFHDPEIEKFYVTGGQTVITVFVTGEIKVEKTEVAVLDNDFGKVETYDKLNNAVSLSANHLQKLLLSFQLISPHGKAFIPDQAIVKMIHETKVEHIFVVENTGKKFKLVLDFLRLVDKFYYLSGKYAIQLIVGDAVMENSFLNVIGNIDLDLPAAVEKTSPPPVPVDPYLRYGPKPEISHIFRAPEKLPPKEISFVFLALTLLPLFGFFIGLFCLGVNLKKLPSSTPMAFSFLFHSFIAAVLLLYTMFWIKLDLFTTLRYLGLLGAFLLFVGHRILSHLASSPKLKSS